MGHRTQETSHMLSNDHVGRDPFTGAEIRFKNWKQIVAGCYELIRKCVAENERRGKTGDERFHVCALHQHYKAKGYDAPRHGYFNLMCHEPEMGITCSSPKAAYGGYLGHAEILLSGKWRIATPEEEA